MADQMTELFTAALGLQSPWKVDQVRFALEANEIHFDLVCDAQRLACPRCATTDQPIHDRLRRDWQHLHYFQYRALIHASVPQQNRDGGTLTPVFPGLGPLPLKG